MQKWQTCGFFACFLITITRLSLLKATDRVKDVITLKPWQNLAGVTDVKTSSFGQMCNHLWGFSLTENQIPIENNRLRLQTMSWWIRLLNCCNVVQRDCEIMMALDLDFRLMLWSREEFSFRNVYLSMLVNTDQLYTQKWFKKYWLETSF